MNEYEPESLISMMLQSYANNDVPPNFYRWGALSMTSTITARNTHFIFNDVPEYLNLYVLFLAESGNRKSVAFANCKSYLDKLGYESFMPQRLSVTGMYHAVQPEAKALRASQMEFNENSTIHKNLVTRQIDALKSQGTSKAKDLRSLRALRVSYAGDPDGAILRATKAKELVAVTSVEEPDQIVTEIGLWYHEFTNLFDSARSTDDLIVLLNDIYDTYSSFSVVRDKMIHRPIVNLLACITPEGLGSSFNGSTFLNGLLPRTHIVYGKVDKAEFTAPSNPFKTKRNLGDSIKITNHLEKMSKIKGQFILSDEVIDRMMLISSIHQTSSDPRLSGYKQRTLIHLTKISCNLALGRLSLKVSIEDVLMANSIMLYTESNVPTALGNFAITPDAKAKAAIMRCLSEEHSVALKQSELVQKVISMDNSLSEAIVNPAIISLTGLKQIASTGTAGMKGSGVKYSAMPANNEIYRRHDGRTFRREYIPEADWNT